MIEEYIPGREIQVAIMGKKKLGTIELILKENFMITKLNMIKMAETKHILPVNGTKKN